MNRSAHWLLLYYHNQPELKKELRSVNCLQIDCCRIWWNQIISAAFLQKDALSLPNCHSSAVAPTSTWLPAILVSLSKVWVAPFTSMGRERNIYKYQLITSYWYLLYCRELVSWTCTIYWLINLYLFDCRQWNSEKIILTQWTNIDRWCETD